MPQRPEDLVEVLPEAEPLLARERAVQSPEERRGMVLVQDLAGEFDAAHAGALAGSFSQAAQVTRSSIARMPPSTPARSMPWIDSDMTYFCFWSSGTVSSVTRRT